MYQNIKPCVSCNGNVTNFFPCKSGVRQGENLSRVLFALFLNDLELSFVDDRCTGVRLKPDDFYNRIENVIEMFVLLYADDAVLLASNAKDLQDLLDSFHRYCKRWRININISKTKVMIFGGSKRDYKQNYTIGEELLENVESFKYLGITFQRNSRFTSTKQNLAEQATKAMYYILSQGRKLHLSVACHLKLFDAMVVPILLYGCEIWGFENLSVIESIHLRFLKYLTSLRKSTPNFMICGELGRTNLFSSVKYRMISFWIRLISGKISKLSFVIYRLLFNDNLLTETNHKWITHMENIFDDLGLSYIWTSQNFKSANYLKNSVKNKLNDINLQSWIATRDSSSKGTMYKIVKNDSLYLENYINNTSENTWKILLKFRTANHNLPVETGRWKKIPLGERKCPLCDLSDIGDEFHYLFLCQFFENDRKSLINKFYYMKPNIYKMNMLFNTHKIGSLRKLSLFCNIIMAKFKDWKRLTYV